MSRDNCGTRNLTGMVGWCLGGVLTSHVGQAAEMDRTQLPIKEPTYPHSKTLDVRDATPPPPFAVTAPEGAPNVLIILIDDMGFGQSSAFGGPIHMPTAERLASQGLRYNRFHTTALSSPTRAALLTGRNHHMCNTGSIMETTTAFPGNTGQRPESIATLAQMLRYNGYSTAMFGKSHETPPWEWSPSGPTDRWPTRSGFDKFYGFMGGETNQWAPGIYEDMTKIEPPHTPGYHFMTDMTDHAIRWVQAEKSLTPGKPFFLYFAPGATHAPHQVPKEWIEKYKGKFDQGWDKLRDETLARQKQLGVVPSATKLAHKPAAIKDWDKLGADEKRLFTRQMEVFAGFSEYADFEIGRLLQTIEDIGQLENTLVFYMIGDNGASAEGGENGRLNEMTYFNLVPETVEDMIKHIDELGGPGSYGHYAAGWAVAGDTPFMWTKQVASNYGGTRNGLVVHWPRKIKAKGEIRRQWHHVIDVTPTVLEAAGLPQPKMVDGIAQTPIEGTSMFYSFNDAAARERHLTQYFEIFGNRAVYHDGWYAGTVHRAPWEQKPRATLQDDTWELYDTRNDFSLANDLAAKNPAQLKKMQAIFMTEAQKFSVLPLDDRTVERLIPATAGRPDLMAGRTSLTLYPGMSVPETVFLNIKNVSHTVTAELVVPAGGADGVIISQGGAFGGWSLYLKDGKPTYTYNWLGREHYDITSTQPIAPGKNTLRFEFGYAGGGMGKEATGTIYVNNVKVGEGKIAKTQGVVFSVDEGVDVGKDGETPVAADYGQPAPYSFTGKLEKVTVTLKPTAAASGKARAGMPRQGLKRLFEVTQ